MSSTRLPFLAEYAKTGKASCTACKQKIAQDVLRIAKVVQSPFHEDSITNWFHVICFFTRVKPKSTEEIKNFDALRLDDQQKIREQIDNAGGADSSTINGTKKGPKRLNNDDDDDDDNNGQRGDCFVRLRDIREFNSVMSGFKIPNKEDKKTIKTKLPKDARPSPKKFKIDLNTKSENDKLMEKQDEELFDLKDHLTTLSKNKLISLLNANDQTVPEETSRIIENLADLMCFGVPLPCDKCKGNLKYKSGVGYKCTGDLDEWTKCENVNIDPPKKKFKVPSHMKKDIEFLTTYKPKIEKRIFKQTFSTKSLASVKKEEGDVDGPEVKETLALKANATDVIPDFTSTEEIDNYAHNDRVKKVTGVISAAYCIKRFYHQYAKKKITFFTVLLSNHKGGSIRVTFFDDDAWRYSRELNVNMVITVDGGRIFNMINNQNKFNDFYKKKTAEIMFMDYSTLKIEKTSYFVQLYRVEEDEDVPRVLSIKEVETTDNKFIEFVCSIKCIYTSKDGFIKEILAGDDNDDEIYLEFKNQTKNENQFKEEQLVVVQGSHSRKKNAFIINNIEISDGE